MLCACVQSVVVCFEDVYAQSDNRDLDLRSNPKLLY
jgi:hypothetical protein